MSAVGSDAAFMLEKALEEMDDIFTYAKQQSLFTSSPKHNPRSQEFVNGVSKILNQLDDFLSAHNFKKNEWKTELESVCNYTNNLPNVKHYALAFSDFVHSVSYEDLQDELLLMRQEKDTHILEISQLKYRLDTMEKNAKMHMDKHDSLELLESKSTESKDDELERLKTHIEALLDEQENRKAQGIEDDSSGGLKKRLREKASEVNRLKLLVEDLKVSHEAKDNAMDGIQSEVNKLREENHRLRQELQKTYAQANGSVLTASPAHSHDSVDGKKKGVVKSIFKVGGGNRSSSEPNLVRNDVRGALVATSQPTVNGRHHMEFRSVRTSGDRGFLNWPVEDIQHWMEDEGLGIYSSIIGKVIQKGDDLMKMTTSDMERELGMTNPLHQKKMVLALQAMQFADVDYMGRLDHNWTARWLDDVGLPQYKDVFFESRVDGRVLHHMTLDDLFHLKVFSTLHHTSLKRSIQLLRHQKFHPNYLQAAINQMIGRENVMLWTNLRVMEWLRAVDLAEYAPNLRGSGVNGALMVLEPRFNADTLANLLSIPPNKTLLRRHVGSQFATLLNETCLKQKELTAKSSDFVPLSSSEKHKVFGSQVLLQEKRNTGLSYFSSEEGLAARKLVNKSIKLRKKGLTFSTLRRRKSESELDQYICPLELDVPQAFSPPEALDPDEVFDISDSYSPTFSNDVSIEQQNGTRMRAQIGEFSHELNTLTTMLSQTR